MSIETCQNFRRAFTRDHNEVSWCTVKGTDMACAGYSDKCPPKLQKFFIPARDIPVERISFK